MQSKFDFKISLNCPYKWCDYRPAVGYVFQEYLGVYDYFGFCDIDVIWGELSRFYPDKLIEKYEKFLVHGHMQLYKNNEKLRTLFMDRISSKVSYRNVFSSKYNYGFDELGRISINEIVKRKGGGGVKQYQDDSVVGDIYPYGNRFLWIKREADPRLSELVPIDYIKISGPKVSLFTNNEERECSYIHLQNRKMSLDICGNGEYYIRHNLISDDINKIRRVRPEHIVCKESGYKIISGRVRRAADLIRYSFSLHLV